MGSQPSVNRGGLLFCRFFRLQREVLTLDVPIQRLGTADGYIRREHLAIIPLTLGGPPLRP